MTMTGGYMNGLGQQSQMPPIAHMPAAEGPPVVTVQNLAFSGNQLRWLVVTAFGLVTWAVGAGYLFMPAKQDDVKALTQVVQTVQQEGRDNRDAIGKLAADNREAVRQLTEAVRAVNETVIDLRMAVEMRPDPAPVQRPVVPRPRRPRPPLPTPALTPPAGAATVPR